MTDRGHVTLAAAAATALAATAMFAIFENARWLPPVLGAIVVVFGASAATRALRLPAPFAPLVAGAATVGYVTVLYAHDAAKWGVVPGRAAMQELANTASAGFVDMRTLAAPVPPHRGLVLLTVVGVAMIALVVDLLAVTLRHPPLAGLPLFAVYAVPAAVVPSGAGVLPFVLGVGGYLGLLLADNRERLARWGRPLRTSAQLQPEGLLAAAASGQQSPSGSVGRRIGAAAIGFALVVPVLVPLRGSLLDGRGEGGMGQGPGYAVTYNPIVALKGDLTGQRTVQLLTLKTSEANPSPYLRMTGLNVFDGQTWRQGPLRGSRATRVSNRDVLPDPLIAGDRVTTEIRVTDALDARWLPLPYQPVTVDTEGDWRYDERSATVFSSYDNVREASYKVTSTRLAPDPATLQRAESLANRPEWAPFLEVPSGLPAVIESTAHRVVGAAKTPYDKAVALQRWFRSSGKFQYSLEVPQGNSPNDMVNFLRNRRGFCEQFAATMALFARITGIPARVAVGFTYGVRAENGSHIVTTRDAHAWPELYFRGVGWLPFEPTPVAGREQATPPEYSVAAGSQDGTGLGAPGQAADPNNPRLNRLGPNERREQFPDEPPPDDPAAGAGADDATGTSWRTILLIALAALGLLAAVTPATLRIAIRRRRWARARDATAHAHAAWGELRDTARDLGYAWPTSASPRSAATWLAERAYLDGAGGDLGLLVTAEERARYARAGAGVGDLRNAVGTVRAALESSASRGARWRARFLPVSAVDRLGRFGELTADTLDRVDAAVARVTHPRRRAAAG